MTIDKFTSNTLALIYAHRLHGMPWKERVLKGWQLVKFRNQLRHGVLRFRYIKTDATIRIAYGTVNLDLIPTAKRPKGTLTQDSYTTIRSFDLVRNEWRSFRITMFIFESVRPCHPVWVADEE